LTRETAFLALAALAAIGCKEREAKGPDLAQVAGGMSYKGDVAPVLDRMCARARGCHGYDQTHSVDLDLRPGASWAQLVGRPAEARKGATRVKAGDPEGSFLVDKLLGRLGPGEGKGMPLDENTGVPRVPSPVGADWVDGILKRWIREGARNN
jgi:hypothetical protein